MTQRLRTIFFIFVLMFSVFPLVSFAQCPGFPYWPNDGCPIVSCSREGNPCENLCQLLQTGQRIVAFGATFLIFALAPLFFAIGGVMIIVASGSPQNLDRGKRILYSALIGLLLAMGTFLIINTFLWLLGLSGLAPNSVWYEINCVV